VAIVDDPPPSSDEDCSHDARVGTPEPMLERQIAEFRNSARAETLSQIRALTPQNGLTAADFTGKLIRRCSSCMPRLDFLSSCFCLARKLESNLLRNSASGRHPTDAAAVITGN